jgi:hypothetical protein
MANFGQRPFMFDIDGYMKVRSFSRQGYQLGGLFLQCLGKEASGEVIAAVPSHVQVRFLGGSPPVQALPRSSCTTSTQTIATLPLQTRPYMSIIVFHSPRSSSTCTRLYHCRCFLLWISHPWRQPGHSGLRLVTG